MNFPGMSVRMQTNERYVWYVSSPYLISPSKSRQKCITYAEAASACCENITLNRN